MPARNLIDANRVRQLFAQGLTQAQVARRLGVTSTGIRNVLKKAKEAAK